MIIRQRDIFFADLNPVVDHEQGGIRPVLIVSNDTGNKHSPNIIVVPITSKTKNKVLPTHIPIYLETEKRSGNSLITVEHIKTISKSRLKEKVCKLPVEEFEKVKVAMKISLSLD